ncbi:hypothetical protein H7U34_07140 [Collinsella tanakaei]|nr:hypothetical protein [Collinsella tanakaei]
MSVRFLSLRASLAVTCGLMLCASGALAPVSAFAADETASAIDAPAPAPADAEDAADDLPAGDDSAGDADAELPGSEDPDADGGSDAVDPENPDAPGDADDPDDPEDPDTPETPDNPDNPDQTGPEAPAGGTGWSVWAGERYWYDDGVMARDKQVYDPGSNAWYWFDADGTMATDKDVFIPVSNEDRSRGKWVRYDGEGHMVKGEDFRYGGWYYLDPITGEMAKGFRYIEQSQKWVFYDYITGKMLYGEQGIDGNWYYLDEVTGAVTYGWHYLASQNKTVYYSWPAGTMVHGDCLIGQTWYRFDPYTGALAGGQQRPSTTIPAGFASALPLDTLLSSEGVDSVRILGDSIMAGLGAPGFVPGSENLLFSLDGESYYEPSASVDCAANRLRSALAARGATMVNASVSGRGSMNFFNRLGEDALGDEDAAIVILGTNDRGAYDRTETLTDFRRYAEELLTRVAERYQGRMIVLPSMPVVRETYNFSLAEVSSTLRSLCSEHGWAFGSLYDAYRYVASAEGLPLEAFYTDGTHPNRLGQEVLWSALSQVLRI